MVTLCLLSLDRLIGDEQPSAPFFKFRAVVFGFQFQTENAFDLASAGRRRSGCRGFRFPPDFQRALSLSLRGRRWSLE